MAIRTTQINGKNKMTDADLSEIFSTLINDTACISGLEVTVGGEVTAGTAFIKCTRTITTPNETIWVIVKNPSNISISVTGTKKVWIEVPQANINDPLLNTNEGGFDIAVLNSGASYPASNYIPLASIVSGVITDERPTITLAPKVRKGLDAWSIMYTDGDGEEKAVALGALNSILSSQGPSQPPIFSSLAGLLPSTQSRVVAGENLSVGNALYIASNGKAYKTNATDTTKIKLFGFAVEDKLTDENIVVDTSGVSVTQSGLTIDNEYYLSDTPGAISTTPGTYPVNIGIAKSAIGLLIKQVLGVKILSASSNYHENSSAVVQKQNTAPQKAKEIRMAYSGNVTVSYELSASTAGQTAVGNIYKNGVAVGTQRSVTGDTYTTFTETIYLNAGDLLQLYIWQNTSGSWFANCRNFKIGYDMTINYTNTIVL